MIAAFLGLVRDLLYTSVANLWTFFKLALLERRLTPREDASEVNAVLNLMSRTARATFAL